MSCAACKNVCFDDAKKISNVPAARVSLQLRDISTIKQMYRAIDSERDEFRPVYQAPNAAESNPGGGGSNRES